MSFAEIRPDLRYSWLGPSVFVIGVDGEASEPLAGFYFREARHLSRLSLEINGKRPWLCEIGSAGQDHLEVTSVHPEMTEFGGGGSGQSGDEILRDENGLPYRALELRLSYRVRVAGLDVELRIANRFRETLAFDLSWELAADFADLLETHGGRRLQEAPVQTDFAADFADNLLRFRYQHPDLPLETRVHAEGAAWSFREEKLTARLRLDSQQSALLRLRVDAVDPENPVGRDDMEEREEHLRSWRARLTRVEVPPNRAAERVLVRNIQDFASFPLLEGGRDEWLALQAGMPLYPALFGRDTLTAGWQAAFLDQGESLAASLCRLGALQSDRFWPARDEEPGRIPYQVRSGPLARLGQNPFAAYYADFATPLMFVISLAHLLAWSGDRGLAERHWDTARRVLDWAREHGDRDGDGYLEYLTLAPEGTKNQGWKDSGDAIVDEEGRAVPAPLGTCELQGYWFAAQQHMAAVAWFLGHREDARAYWRSSQELKERFNRDWWIEDERFFGMAMGPDKRLIRTIGSNAGHCLASGIVSGEHVPALVERLFAPDLWSGWGIRTLSSDHPAYSPLSYHLGSVWAVEAGTIALGLKRYGFDDRTAELAGGLFDLAELYRARRIPECVGGFSRREHATPGAYPRANTPQTWNASTFPLLLHSLLGLQPVAPLDLLVVDPALPPWLPEVFLRGLRLGRATLSLRFWRDEKGASHAEILEKEGTVRLVRQPPPESLTHGIKDRLSALVDGLVDGLGQG